MIQILASLDGRLPLENSEAKGMGEQLVDLLLFEVGDSKNLDLDVAFKFEGETDTAAFRGKE